MCDRIAWRLFLDDDADDLRRPDITVENAVWRSRAALAHTPPSLVHLGEWVIARSYKEAVEAIDRLGFPTFVSFDHDIGTEAQKTGLDVAKYLIELDLDTGTMPEDFAFEVHSANPIGRRNIAMLFKSYLAQKVWPSRLPQS